MKDEMKDALSKAFYAPEPENKKVFLKNIRPREVSTMEMLLQQVKYIRHSVWFFALLIVGLALLGSWIRLDETDELIPVLMPFMASISVFETRRSKKYGMSELELVTRFSLRSVIFARMTALGLLYLLVLGIISPVIATAFDEKILLIARRIIIPYLITMSVSLQVERSAWGRKMEYASLAIAIFVSVSISWIRSYDPIMIQRYVKVIENWGVLIVLILAAITVFEQWRTINDVEEYA